MPALVSRKPRVFRLVLLVLAAPILAGCATSPSNIPQQPDLRIHGRVLFIPLRTAAKYYYDSADGIEIAQAAGAAVRLNAPQITALDYDKVRGLVRSTVMAGSVGNQQWKQIGSALAADYVVHGSIDNISWTDPDDPIMPRCVFTVSYAVFDVAAGADVYSVTRAGRYPYMLAGDKGVSVFEMGPEGLRIRAFLYIGQLIARTFYAYRSDQFEKDALSTTKHETHR